MGTPTIRTSQDIATYIYIYIYIYLFIFLKWSIDITIFVWKQSYQSAVGTPTRRTSQDITTYMFLKWSIDITLFIWTQSCQSAVGTPTLGTYQHISIYIYIHLKVLYETPTLLALPQLSFFQAKPMSDVSHLQSSGLLWVVTSWHVHSLRPASPLVSCLVTQAGTCSAGITRPLT